MSDDRFPYIMGLFGLVDGLLGCLVRLMKFVFWLILLLIVAAVVGGHGQ